MLSSEPSACARCSTVHEENRCRQAGNTHDLNGGRHEVSVRQVLDERVLFQAPQGRFRVRPAGLRDTRGDLTRTLKAAG